MTDVIEGSGADDPWEIMDGIVERDLLSLILGDFLGGGIARNVYAFAPDPGRWVVKLENGAHSFQNILEWEHWNCHQYDPDVSRWLAPCRAISQRGLWLIQARTKPAETWHLPDQMPKFLTDLKPSNFGILEASGQLVCHDYGLVVPRLGTKLKKAKWS